VPSGALLSLPSAGLRGLPRLIGVISLRSAHSLSLGPLECGVLFAGYPP
jgi:hypothetical protein